MFKTNVETAEKSSITGMGEGAQAETINITQGALRATMRQTMTGRSSMAGGLRASLAGRASQAGGAAGAAAAAGGGATASPRRASNVGRVAPRTSMRHGIGQTIQRPPSVIGVKHAADSHPPPRASMFAHRTRIEPIGEDHDDDHAEPAPSA